jgi:hypothetical protein
LTRAPQAWSTFGGSSGIAAREFCSDLRKRARIEREDVERWRKDERSKSDSSVLGRIDSLVQEEERLYAKTQLSEEDGKRLGELKVELDQCWDLLRQRRALREFGRDPETAKVRSTEIVENYEQ